jgi:ABC-type multidrug transport system fused ATPase/permease subunit
MTGRNQLNGQPIVEVRMGSRMDPGMDGGVRRARALPLWGSGVLPDSRKRDASKDRYSFGSVFRLLLRSWPFISTQIFGEWRQRRLPVGERACAALGAAVRGYGWMPPLVTLLWFCGEWGGWLGVPADANPSAQFWGAIASWMPGGVVAAAWGALFTRGKLRFALCALGAGAGLLAFILSWAYVSGAAPKLYTLALATGFSLGWFVRVEPHGDRLHAALRVQSHMVYYYGFSTLSRAITLASSAFMVSMLYQNILQGLPLTPGMAGFLGLPEYSTEVVKMLTADQRWDVLWYYIGFTVALFVVQLPFVALLPYYIVFILQRINQDLRLALVERWHRLSLRYHSEHRVGDSVYRIYQDSAQVTAVVGQFLAAATAVSSLVMSVVVLSFLSPVLAAIAFGIGVPVMGWGRWFSPRMRARSLEARETNSDLTSRIQEIVSGVRVIKAYGAESREQDRFEEDSVVAFNAAYGARSLLATATIVTFTITTAFLLPGEYLMALWARAGNEVFATGLLLLVGVAFARWNVAGFSWSRTQFFDGALSFRDLSRRWAASQDMVMGLHRVFDILDIEPDVQDAPDAIALPAFRESICFENVSFGYRADRPILHDVSFRAEPGTITAIVGPTGAGKSTLVMLMLRLFDPDRGRITIDGHDLRGVQVESLREHVSIALQENILFAMSVADNIRYVTPDADERQVREAARIACADEFIDALPQGYDTELGDHGGKLSTGQRQRISIARALIKNAPILVLDEPTAALDAETEHRVMGNLHEWGKDRVIFVITHRLSTIRQADQILYLQEGELREMGRHDELMRLASGRYRGLIETEEHIGSAGLVAGEAGAR